MARAVCVGRVDNPQMKRTVIEFIFGALAAFLMVALLAALLGVVCRGDEPPTAMKSYHEILRISGNDEAKDSAKFTVHAHWRVVCAASKVGPEMQVAVWADPDAGEANLNPINMSADGVRTEYIRDGGIYHLSVQGFDASWTVTVEDLR